MSSATMNRFKLWTLGILNYLILLIVAHANPEAHVPGRILLEMKPGVSERTTKALMASLRGNESRKIRHTQVRVIKVPPKAWAKVLAALKKSPLVKFAEPDYVLATASIVNDPYYSYQWHLPRVSIPEAWMMLPTDGDIRIGIIDTGVDALHPDLQGRVTNGWNFFEGNNNTADVHGHGTAVAGVAAAAINNLTYIASVAGFMTVVPVRVTDVYGYTSESIIAEGITYASDQGCRVINVSFNASYSPTVSAAAQYARNKGAVVVVAAGNGGYFDESTDNPNVITVSATGRDDLLPSWSNRGNNIDLSAPGQDILTLSAGGGTLWKSGTSFAAPVVAGVAALVTYANPNLSATQVEQVIKDSAGDLGTPGWDANYGNGIVNASNAVARALTLTPLAGEQFPTVLEEPEPGEETAQEAGADVVAPLISIISPQNDSVLSGRITVKVAATDNVAVTEVQLWVNGTRVAASKTAPYTIKWNLPRRGTGIYSLQTVAFDAAGNAGTSQFVNVSPR